MGSVSVCSIFVLIFLCDFTLARKLPPYITPCPGHPQKVRADCLKNSVDKLRPRLKDGIPEMGLPSMNPLVLPEVAITANNFKMIFHEMRLFEIYGFIVNAFDVNIDTNEVFINITVPKCTIQTGYTVDGRMLIFQLHGQGQGNIILTNTTYALTFNGTRHIRPKNKKEYLQLKLKNIEAYYGKPKFNFDNLFANNEQLTQQTNLVLNENVESLIEELRPALDSTISNMILFFAKRIFSRYALTELFTG